MKSSVLQNLSVGSISSIFQNVKTRCLPRKENLRQMRFLLPHRFSRPTGLWNTWYRTPLAVFILTIILPLSQNSNLSGHILLNLQSRHQRKASTNTRSWQTSSLVTLPVVLAIFSTSASTFYMTFISMRATAVVKQSKTSLRRTYEALILILVPSNWLCLLWCSKHVRRILLLLMLMSCLMYYRCLLPFHRMRFQAVCCNSSVRHLHVSNYQTLQMLSSWCKMPILLALSWSSMWQIPHYWLSVKH